MTHHIACIMVDGSDEPSAVARAAAIMDTKVGDKRRGYPFDGAAFIESSSRYTGVPTVRRADDATDVLDTATYVFDEGTEWVVTFDVHR